MAWSKVAVAALAALFANGANAGACRLSTLSTSIAPTLASSASTTTSSAAPASTVCGIGGDCGEGNEACGGQRDTRFPTFEVCREQCVNANPNRPCQAFLWDPVQEDCYYLEGSSNDVPFVASDDARFVLYDKECPEETSTSSAAAAPTTTVFVPVP
ncbi:hypothetical protein ACJZ2D_004038 [Fusarium nematophilum]